ncbi:hypothetical protein Acid345_3161 [Candidatus Koribacter versatilis Ellin345]|uniref:Phage tail tape measure protein domain-containing protein n=1 Tax=Koribacter versatilis (strain Ellin345) TaxID=204669 RepID=Q1ILT8_KORVE|nr:phage tail tape measure protein [Candidatus Koribacter versatilis]ABF42162.1 hypothetical protein Acid345_3161 [Candidatus Koribacter versatilis Ellin345]
MDNNVKVIIQGVNQAGAAIADVKEGLASIEDATLGVGEAFGAMQIAEWAKEFGDFVAETADSVAALGRLSQQSGTAASEFMALKGAAEQSDIPTETLAISLKKLSTNMAEAGAGNAKALQLFKDLGVSATDASGKLRPVTDVLLDISERFKDYADGAGKSALAVQAFGRGGDAMISFLDKGKQAISEAAAEATKFGDVLGGDALDAVIRFHDETVKLQMEAEGFKVQFVAALTQELGPLADAFKYATGNTDSFSASFGKFLGHEGGAFFKDTIRDVAGYGLAIAEASLEISKITAEFFGAEAAAQQFDQGLAALKTETSDFFKLLDAAPKGLLSGFLGGLGSDVDAAIANLDKAFPTKKPSLTVTAPDNTEKLLKAQQELRKAYAAQDVAIAQGEAKDQLAALELEREQGLVTLGDYYKQRYDITIGAVDNEIYALSQELAAQQKVVDAAKKGSPEQVQAEAQLVQIQNQVIAKMNERGALVSSQATSQIKAERDFGYQVLAIQAQIDEAKDHSAEVAIAAINKEYDEKRRILQAAGKDTTELDQAKQMAIAAAKAENLAKQIDTVYADLEEKVAAVNEAISNGTINQIDGQTKVQELNGRAAGQLTGLIQQYQALAEASGNPALITNADKFQKKLDDLGKHASLMGDLARQAFERGFESFLSDVENGKWINALEDFGKAFLDVMNQILAKMLAVYVMQKVLGWIGGAVGGVASTPGGSPTGGGDVGSLGDVGITPFFASGGHMDAGDMGVVGDQGPELWVPDVGGHVVPMSGMSDSSALTVHNHIAVDARGAQVGFAEQLAIQLRATEEKAVKRAVFETEERRRRRA